MISLDALPRSFAALATAIGLCETATEALTLWCERWLPAGDGMVVARVLADAPERDAAAAAALGASPDEVLHHRRVELMWGPTVVERAETWYLPGRLDAAMRTRLAEGVPLGPVIKALRPRRIVTSMQTSPTLRIGALVTTEERGIIALVREEYQAVLVEGALPLHPTKGNAFGNRP